MEVPQNVDEETAEFLCLCPGISSVYNWLCYSFTASDAFGANVSVMYLSLLEVIA